MAKKKNRSTKRKEEVKKIQETENEKLNLQDKLFVVFCIVMFFVAFYVLTLYITHKNSEPTTNIDTEDVSFSYDEILLGRSFSMNDSEYYVIYYDSSNEEIADTCSNLVTTYRQNHDTTLYFVDMSNGLNSSYATTEESNKSPNSAGELLINGPTVIKIADGKLVDYVEGLEAIQNYLN